MLRLTLLSLLVSFISLSLHAQNYRTIDGSMNNLQQTQWGTAGGELQRITPAAFGDSISTPNGTNRPNPRIISNAMFAQDSLLTDSRLLSDFTWVFGQFIDHDVTSVPNDPTESAHISVNFVDPIMNPTGIFPVTIPMSRSLEMPGTGTSTSNPRGYMNNITAWIDGSGVYGSDHERADWLRTFSDGKLKTSAGNLMPFNTTTGELDDPIDTDAPEMDNENPFNNKLFIAGDSRANENPLLTSFHTLFVREHNRLCDELIIAHPDWNDEELYQHARKIVGALIQNVTYNEWLPEMGVHLPTYNGYDTSLNPNISNVFSAAAFRLGHTLLNSNILRIGNDGEVIPEGNITLKDAFFNPLSIIEIGGLDPLFKGMAAQVEQELDTKVVDDVRNFLFGPPGSGAGGLDLAAINIKRGRERGLADFNSIRAEMGLPPYQSCSQICGDPEISDLLEQLYGDVNNVDPWVGLLAETHMSDALFGETIMEIMTHQFTNLREGDRFYFENDPVLTPAEIAEIKETTLRHIVMRNTGITIMQENVFVAMPHDSICPAYNSLDNINGIVATEWGVEVEGVTLDIDGFVNPGPATTNSDGEYTFAQLPTCEGYTVTPRKGGDYRNGVTTFDIILTNKHILNIQSLNSPYKLIAADVNNSGSVTTFDLVSMRKLVLALDDEFANNTTWRFIDATHDFNDPTNPFAAAFPESVQLASLTEEMQLDFVAIKVGDVTGDANPANFQSTEDRKIDDELIFEIEDRQFKAGEMISLAFRAPAIAQTIGYQFTLDYDSDVLDLDAIEPGLLSNLTKENFAVHSDKAAITTSWNGQQTLDPTGILYTMQFRAKANGQLSELLNISSSLTTAEAYTSQLEVMNVGLQFTTPKAPISLASSLVLHQNRPNPFSGNTIISFELPADSEVSLKIYDLAGRQLHEVNGQYFKGYHEITLDKESLQSSGLLYYQLETATATATRKMILRN